MCKQQYNFFEYFWSSIGWIHRYKSHRYESPDVLVRYFIKNKYLTQKLNQKRHWENRTNQGRPVCMQTRYETKDQIKGDLNIFTLYWKKEKQKKEKEGKEGRKTVTRRRKKKNCTNQYF